MCEAHPEGPFLKNGRCHPCQKAYNAQYYLDRKTGKIREKIIVIRQCHRHPMSLVWKNGHCKSCYLEQWRKDNPEKCAELEAARDPEKRKAQHRSSHHRRRYTISIRRKEERLNRKIRVLTHYSGGQPQCARCPESRLSALGLDHKGDDGAAHRRHTLRRGGDHTYRWAIKNNFPDVFEVLCHSCNWLKHLETIVRNDTQSSLKAHRRRRILDAHDWYKDPKLAEKARKLLNALQHRGVTLADVSGWYMFRKLREEGFARRIFKVTPIQRTGT